MRLLAAVKQLPECASDTIISILQRGVTAEDTGRCLFWEGPIGSCLVTPGVWAQPTGEVGAASWAWGAAGLQSSKGPASPQGEIGRQWIDICIWPGRGVQAGNVTGIITGRKRKGQEGSDGSQLTPCRCWWSFGSNSEPEGLALRNSAVFSCSFVKHGVRV